jgi:hypothetical protein
MKQSLAICDEALPGPLEGERGFPSRRREETEEGEGRVRGRVLLVPSIPPSPAPAAYSSASAEPCPFLFLSRGLRSFFTVFPVL